MKNQIVAGDIAVTSRRGVPCLDLRQVTVPPKPLVAILELLEHPGTGDKVLVLMSRDPVNLYPELVERNWNWQRRITDDGEYQLTLTRQPSGNGQDR
jgi:hypothetical protein